MEVQNRIVTDNGFICGVLKDGESLSEFMQRKKPIKVKRPVGRPIKGKTKWEYKRKTDFKYHYEDKSLIGTSILI